MFRPINNDDMNLVTSCNRNDPVSMIVADRFRRELAEHKYRLPWSWIFEDNGRLLARALWWGASDRQFPWRSTASGSQLLTSTLKKLPPNC